MNKHIGSNFDDFLNEEGVLAEVEAVALKRVIAYQVQDALKQQKISKTELAQRLHTSRSSLDRLLDPHNTSITLKTLIKVAHILGRSVKVSFAT